MSATERIPILVIVGPTAVGKTAFSIALAKASNAEIVSADSRYFYRGMTIGTAKPTSGEMDGVRHHLIDVSDPDERWSLARFQREADAAIRDIAGRGKNVMASDDEIALLCDIAMDGDRGICEVLGLDFKLGKTIAKGDPICEIRIKQPNKHNTES